MLNQNKIVRIYWRHAGGHDIAPAITATTMGTFDNEDRDHPTLLAEYSHHLVKGTEDIYKRMREMRALAMVTGKTFTEKDELLTLDGTWKRAMVRDSGAMVNPDKFPYPDYMMLEDVDMIDSEVVRVVARAYSVPMAGEEGLVKWATMPKDEVELLTSTQGSLTMTFDYANDTLDFECTGVFASDHELQRVIKLFYTLKADLNEG